MPPRPARAVGTQQLQQALALTSLDAMPDPRHSAFVIIDMQNDFCHPDGLMGRRGEDVSDNATIVPVIASLLAAARRAGGMVVHVHGQYGLASGSPVSLFGAGGQRVALDICLP